MDELTRSGQETTFGMFSFPHSVHDYEAVREKASCALAGERPRSLDIARRLI